MPREIISTPDWIRINGARLRYARRRGPGPALVLLHEMGGTLESFTPLLPLLDPDWNVLRYDQRGAGLSDPVAPPLRLDTPVADLNGLLAGLALEGPVVLAGAALGAAVAIGYAARYPEKVAGLVLMAPATGIAPEKRAATLERIAALESGPALHPPGPIPIGQTEPITLDRASYGATYRMLVGLDLPAELAAIACPTLLLAGRKDAYRPPDHVAALAEKIARAELSVLDTGHVMALETPGPVAEALNAFGARLG